MWKLLYPEDIIFHPQVGMVRKVILVQIVINRSIIMQKYYKIYVRVGLNECENKMWAVKKIRGYEYVNKPSPQ